MVGEEQPNPQENKQNNVEKIKNNQQRLKAQIKELEDGLSAPRVYSFQTEELREMVQTLLTQNKRLAEKVDYLLSILVEASSELSDDVIDKTLAAMAKSQLDMMDQLSSIKEKTEAGKTKSEELERMYQSTDDKLKTISDSISSLSYAKQLEDLKSNVDTISSDIQKLGAAISAETPQLKENIDTVRSELAELKQKVSDIGLFGSEIKEVEAKLANLEAILSKKEQRAVAELGPSDKKAIRDFSQKLADLSNEVMKMEKVFETYPASEAQGLTSIRQKLDEIDATIGSLKQVPQQEGVVKEIEGLREKINSLENMFEEKELDMEKKRAAEMQVMTDLLRKIESDLETISGQQADQLSQVLSDVNEKTKQMADSLQKAKAEKTPQKYFDELRKEVFGLGARLSRIEEYVKKEKVTDSSHIGDIRTEIRAIRRELENMGGLRVKPETISKVREGIASLDFPAARVIEPQEREKIKAIKANISRTQEALKPEPSREAREVKKGLVSAEEKVNNIMKEMNKIDDAVIEKREMVKKLRGEVLGAPLREEDVVSNYLSKVMVDVPVRVRDMSVILNMDVSQLTRALIKMQKESPHKLSLKNTSYVSKLFGKEPVVIRLQ